MHIQLKVTDFFERHAVTILFLTGIVLLNAGLADYSFAQEGGQIFQDAAKKIVCQVLPGTFGAMLSAFAGIFALIAAAIGAYRAVWALVFVSVGCFIAQNFVGILFGETVTC